jgi:hypothetical protein
METQKFQADHHGGARIWTSERCLVRSGMHVYNIGIRSYRFLQ